MKYSNKTLNPLCGQFKDKGCQTKKSKKVLKIEKKTFKILFDINNVNSLITGVENEC